MKQVYVLLAIVIHFVFVLETNAQVIQLYGGYVESNYEDFVSGPGCGLRVTNLTKSRLSLGADFNIVSMKRPDQVYRYDYCNGVPCGFSPNPAADSSVSARGTLATQSFRFGIEPAYLIVKNGSFDLVAGISFALTELRLQNNTYFNTKLKYRNHDRSMVFSAGPIIRVNWHFSNRLGITIGGQPQIYFTGAACDDCQQDKLFNYKNLIQVQLQAGLSYRFGNLAEEATGK